MIYSGRGVRFCIDQKRKGVVFGVVFIKWLVFGLLSFPPLRVSGYSIDVVL
jgi:hypothetical protein